MPEENELEYENAYSLSRELANEYYSDEYQGFKSFVETQQAMGKSAQETQTEVKTGGLTEPDVDPVTAFAGGFGGGLISAGRSLLPTLGRATVEGLVGAAADYPLGAVGAVVTEKYPKLSLPFNLTIGLLSGATVERSIEKSIINIFEKSGTKIQGSTLKREVGRIKNILADESGAIKIKDDDVPILKSVSEDLNKQVGELPVSKTRTAIPPREIGLKKAESKFFGIKPELAKKYSANINLERINAPEDLKASIDRTSKLFSKQIKEASRGVRSNAMTQKAADDLGMTVNELLGRRSGEAFNAEEALSARMHLAASAENLTELANKIEAGNATDIDRFEFRKALNLHYAIQAQVSGMTAEAGRALQSFKILSKAEQIKTSQIKELLSSNIKDVSDDDLARAITSMDDLSQITKFTRQLQHATTKDMFLEAWINGLLSGPQTHAVNSLSNTLTALWQIPERAVASQIGRILPGQREIRGGEVISQAFGMVEGITDGWKLFSKSVREGLPTDPQSKLDALKRKAITAQNVQDLPIIKKIAPNMLQEGGMPAHFVDFIGESVRVPGRMLMAEDEFFKAIGYRMELKARAYRKAIVEEGLTGNAASERIQQIVGNPEKYAPEIQLAAIDASRYQTFTKPLSDKVISSLSQSDNPVLRIIVPFVRTPTNILKFAGERTPFAFLSKNIRADIAAGGAKRDLALARMAMGSAAMIYLTTQAAQGNITGGGPSDPTMQAAWRRAGWKPYSIKVGDNWVQYGRLEPLGILAGLAADFAALSGMAGEELQPEVDEYAGAIIAAISKNITSKTWLRGISEAISAMEDPDRYGPKYIQSFTKSLVPSAIAQVERTIDPDLQTVYSIGDALKSRIPGLSKDLPPRRDLWGNKITTVIDSRKRSRSWGEIVYGIFSPIYISKAINSPIDNEILNLGLNIRKPSKIQHFDGETIELSPHEYDKFIVLMNKILLRSTGKNLKQSLDYLVTKDERYKNQNDPEIKKDMISAKFSEAKNLAKHQLRNEIPSIDLIIGTKKEERRQQRSFSQPSFGFQQ